MPLAHPSRTLTRTPLVEHFLCGEIGVGGGGVVVVVVVIIAVVVQLLVVAARFSSYYMDLLRIAIV